MFKKNLLTIAMVTMGVTAFAQTVGVNTDGNPADPSALLDVRSTDKGMLIPRMDMAARDAIANPATGLLIFQTDNTAGFYYNSGTPGAPAWTMISNAITPSNVTQTGAVVVTNGAGQTMGTGDVSIDVQGTSGGVMVGQGAGISATFTAGSLNPNEVLATPIAGGAPVWMDPNSLLTTNDVTPATGSSVVISNGTGQVVGAAPVSIDVQGTQGGVMYGTGTGSAATFSAAGTAGLNQYLMSNGTAAPTFVTPKEIFTVPLTNNFTTASGVPQNSAFAQSLAVNAGLHANYAAPLGQNLAVLLAFYSANQNVNFLGCSGWISVQNFIPSNYEIRIMKYSIVGNLTANATVTGVEIASQLNVNAGDATATAGKYEINLTSSPVPLVPGDVLVMYVRNMQAGTARTHLSFGHAYFSKDVQ